MAYRGDKHKKNTSVDSDGDFLKKTRHKSRFRSVITTLIILICLGVMAYAGYNIFGILKEDYQADEEYAGIKGDEYIEKIEVEDSDTGEIQIKDVVLIKDLKKINKDTVAWIRIPNTVIDYPIVQAKDNQYYLTHTFNNKVNRAGAIFMECQNSPDFSDQNTIIYGHHMKRGVMFAKIVDYKKQDFYDNHKEFYIYLPGSRTLKAQVFASYECAADYNFTQISFSTDEKFAGFISAAQKMSRIRTDVEVTTEDKLVTLSTCDYEFEDARFIVVAKLVEI